MTAGRVNSTRRVLQRTITTVVVLATSVVLAGCGTASGAGSAPAPVASGASATGPVPDGVAVGTTVMIIRHGEKPDGVADGIDVNGHPDERSLTAVGWERAHRLVDLFDPVQGGPRPGLSRPATIYAAGANENGQGQRTRETVMPLAEQLGVTVNTGYGKGDEEKLVEHVLTQPGPTLISWQHGEIPTIAEEFPGVTPDPPSDWPDERFDVVWTLSKTAEGWHFDQLPESVLPRDQASVIEDDDD